MKNTEVEIFGATYAVKGDEDAEYVRSLARFVDDRMRMLARKSPASPSHKVAVLTALNIADELFRLRRRQQEMEETLRRKTGDLFSVLEDETSL